MMFHQLSTRDPGVHGFARLAALIATLAPLATAACASSSSGGSATAGDDSGTTMTQDDASTPKDASTGKDTGTSSGDDSGSTTEEASTGGDSGGGGPALALPFFVSDQFIPSGFMNDPTGITVSTGANGAPSCPTRAPTSGGDCYVINWASTGPLWAGVYWQYPSNNWGTQPGLVIAPGAQQVSFYARGDQGGEQVQFKVGGINEPLMSSVGAYGDSFAVSSTTETLTTSWQQYTVSLQGSSYPAGVLGGFCWVAASVDGGTTNIKFYLDDVQWQ